MNELLFCIKCGHELKTGAMYCPYCGTKVTYSEDLISTSARYENYNPINTNIEGRATMDGKCSPSREEPNSLIKCFTCSSLIPGDSKYCPICQTQLFVECPKCGHKYSAQYANCNECGTNREEYLRQQKMQEEARRQSAIEKEAQRIANLPKIVSFTHKKFKNKYQAGDALCLSWSTVNVEYCDLSYRKKDCWYYYVDETAPYSLKGLSSSCNAYEITPYRLQDMCPLFGSNHQIPIRLEAYGKNGERISETIYINIRTFWFDPLEIL